MFIWAAENDHLEIVKFLCFLDSVNPSARNYADQKAAIYDHIANFSCSFDSVDPSDGKHSVLRMAAQNGYLEIVELLCSFDLVDSFDCNYTIQIATQYDHADIVKFLRSIPEHAHHQEDSI